MTYLVMVPMVKKVEKEKTVISKVGICSKVINSKGFSLLEILLVLFIISLVSGIIFPYISSDKQSKSDIKTVVSILKFTYETTLATKSPCTLRFDLQEKQILLDCLNDKREYKIDSLYGVNTSSKGTIKEGVVTIIYELGKGESITIHLFKGDSIAKVNLSPLSGRVKILDS